MRVVSHQLKKLIRFSHACTGFLLGGLLACAVATAQPKYQFDHWTTDDGLPQNAVNAILQTRDGYLWLATYDGLVRFDGLQFAGGNPWQVVGTWPAFTPPTSGTIQDVRLWAGLSNTADQGAAFDLRVEAPSESAQDLST